MTAKESSPVRWGGDGKGAIGYLAGALPYFNCVVLDVCVVRVGDFTLFGPAVQIYTATHPLNAELRRRQEYAKPVEIGSDVWIGGGVVLCPGVRIGSKAVIGAGSVVTRDIPD